MKPIITLLILAASFTAALAQDKTALTSLDALNQLAKQKLSAQANVPLANEKAELCVGADVLEAGKVPNYVRALALLPNDWSGPAVDSLRLGVAQALRRYYEAERGSGDQLLQAHVPVALARLLPPGSDLADAWRKQCHGDLRRALRRCDRHGPRGSWRRCGWYR